MACDSKSVLATAYSSGYAKLSDRELREAIVASACAGGGGGSGSVAHGAAAPVAAPAGGDGVYTQTTGPHLFSWNGTAWVQWI